MLIEMGAASHVGQVRSVNEDAYLAAGSLAVVADGMGGHACGDVASNLTVREFQTLAERGDLGPLDIREALEQANRAILDDAARDVGKRGMGTTVCGLALVDYNGFPHWLVFNVGDSRVYRLSGPRPVQLTVDHSEVAELVAAGEITSDEARQHPLRNVVTRSLGSDPAPAADVWIFPPQSGDTFVICSDGLTTELDDVAISELAAQAETPDAAAAHLVEAAVNAGGRDNVTAVVVRVSDADTLATETTVATMPRKQTWGSER